MEEIIEVIDDIKKNNDQIIVKDTEEDCLLLFNVAFFSACRSYLTGNMFNEESFSNFIIDKSSDINKISKVIKDIIIQDIYDNQKESNIKVSINDMYEFSDLFDKYIDANKDNISFFTFYKLIWIIYYE